MDSDETNKKHSKILLQQLIYCRQEKDQAKKLIFVSSICGVFLVN